MLEQQKRQKLQKQIGGHFFSLSNFQFLEIIFFFQKTTWLGIRCLVRNSTHYSGKLD